MNRFSFVFFKSLFSLVLLSGFTASEASNQTDEMSPIRSGDALPFKVKIKQEKKKNGTPFLLPDGLQSYVFAEYKGKWIFLAGRTNGMHGFNDDPNNFPPRTQNRTVYVIDIKTHEVSSRSLDDAESGLTQDQIDSLSVTASQFYQTKRTLYLTGGYGYRNAVNQHITFDTLTAIDIPGMIQWVTRRCKTKKAAHHIRQISDPSFAITGGAMYRLSKKGPVLLVFGQKFTGPYESEADQQVYSKQVRRFNLQDNGTTLKAEILPSTQENENYRRRDLNIVPRLQHTKEKGLIYSLVALSGVFTESRGIWTVPVNIRADGHPSMPDPLSPTTLKQGVNNYASPYLSLFSRHKNEMYTVIFGGLTYEYFENGDLLKDDDIPFTNQIVTIKINKNGIFSQYMMEGHYPTILSTGSNAGSPLLFGTSAYFIPDPRLDKIQYKRDIFKLDLITKPLVIGYIVGGIQSTVMNTTYSLIETAASPYIFKVILVPRRSRLIERPTVGCGV